MRPINPVTIETNGLIMDAALKNFFRDYLPGFKYQITSGFRTPDENRDVGGVSDSAHLYNLARDIVILDNAGKPLSEVDAKKIFNEFFSAWPGYALFEPGSDDVHAHTSEGYHIHLNLDRDISGATKYIGIAAGLFVAGIAVKKLWPEIRKKINV